MAYDIYEEIFKYFSSEQARALIFAFESLQRKNSEVRTQGVQMTYDVYEGIYKQFSSEQAQALIYTLELFQRKISENQTEEVIYKTRNSLSNEFATKSDLIATEERLEKKFLEVKLELKEDIANVRNELKEDIANVRNELKEVEKKVVVLSNNFFQMEKNLENRIDGFKFSILNWMGGIAITTITITLAGVGLMIKFL